MRRASHRRFWLAVAALGLSVALALAALWAWAQWSGALPEPLPHIPHAVDKSLGVNTDLSLVSADVGAEVLAQMETAGVKWLRQRFAWDRLEPVRGQPAWKDWDRLIALVAQSDVELVAVLDGSPDWARSSDDAGNPLAPPSERRDFGDFAAAFAERYGEQIDYYQIWDEPNIAPHWGNREIDPRAYALLLREGAIRIRAADPGAVILVAALAPNVETGGANMSELLFLDELYRAGAAEWFDVVAAQPYGFDMAIDSQPGPLDLNWRRVALLRDVMERYGDTSSAIWAVSFGLATIEKSVMDQLVLQSRSEWPWLGPMFWAAWFPDDTHGRYALAREGKDPGSSLSVLQDTISAEVHAWPGSYPADHWSGQYVGDWRVADSGADCGATGDKLMVGFRGTGLQLQVRRGEYRAFFYITVDGVPASELPSDSSGRAYVVLYDPLGSVETVALARNLNPGEHTAEIVTERGWGQWSIAGWVVTSDPSRSAPSLPVVLTLVTAVLLGGGIWLIWPVRGMLLNWVSLVSEYVRSLDDRLMLGATAGAAFLLYVMDGLVPVLLALGLLGLLLMARPKTGLPLIAASLPFTQLGRPVLGKVFSMTEILTLLTAAGWLASWLLGRWQVVANQSQRTAPAWGGLRMLSGLDWTVLLLVGWSALSLLWSEHGHVAAREFRTVILESALFYGLFRAMVKDWRHALRIADAWIAGAAIIALVGVSQWILGSNVITADGVWRVRGFYGSPNNLALYLGRALPLAVVVGLSLSSGAGLRRWRSWLYGAAALAMAGAIFLTYSRGAWLLGVPAALLFIAAVRSRRALFLAGAVLAVIGAGAVLLVGTERLTSLLNTAQGTTFFRLQLWKSSLTMLSDHPVLGVGLDNFLYHYRTYYVLPSAWEEFNLSHPHNLLLDFWLRLGLPGVLILGVILTYFFRLGLRRYAALSDGDARWLVLGSMAGMIYFAAHGLVDNAYFLVDLAYAFVLMLGFIQVKSGLQTAR